MTTATVLAAAAVMCFVASTVVVVCGLRRSRVNPDAQLRRLAEQLGSYDDPTMELAIAAGVAPAPGEHEMDRRMPGIVRAAQIARCERIVWGDR